jgi:beta-galactosidase/beta-glucuronidase
MWMAIDRVDLHSSLDGNGGLIQLTLQFVHPQLEQTARLVCNDASITLQRCDTQTLAGRLRVPDAPRRCPHTHGEPALHRVALEFTDNEVIELGRIGFRELRVDRGPLGDGFQLIETAYLFLRAAHAGRTRISYRSAVRVNRHKRFSSPLATRHEPLASGRHDGL